MKTRLFFCLLPFAFCLCFTGCKSMTPDQQAGMVQQIATEATSIGAAVDLQAHPERKPLYAAAKGALDKLINEGNYNPLEFQKALRLLPLGALRGENGALIAQGILSVWTLASGYIDIANSPPLVKAAITGTRDGLALALAPTLANAGRSRRVITQCQPPPR